MLNFILIISDNAKRQIKELPKEIQYSLINRLESAEKKPFHFFIRLKNRLDYKLRCGNYRVIANINVNNRKIIVTKVGHRKNIYEKL